MRYANILLFLVATALGITLSVAFMWKLPFGIFTVTDDGFRDAISLLKGDFYAAEALRDVAMWGNSINFVAAVICAVLTILPALLTVRVAESKLFERVAFRGWQMIKWMAALGALAVAIHPVPVYILVYILACALLICGYIVTYQWPKKLAKKDPLQMPELREARQWSHRRIAGETSQQP